MMPSTSNYGGWFGHSTGTGGAIADITKVVTLCASLMVSTGTGAKPDDAAMFKAKNPSNRMLRNFTPAISYEEELPCNKVLEKVMTVFPHSVSELSKVFGVSRQTLYNWKHGERLSEANEEKLRLMGKSADLFLEANISVTSSILKRIVFENKTLLNIARDSTISIYNATEILISRLVKEREQQIRLASRFANRQQTKEFVDSELTPINDRS